MQRGEQARIELFSSAVKTSMRTMTAAEIQRELAWRTVRLEFDALPLAAAVAEFNLRNTRQLTIVDPTIGQMRVAGSFRADEVEFWHRGGASGGRAVDAAPGRVSLRWQGKFLRRR
jgi:ferric-dicitrate binding protein FerR (iron transport regulator)